MHGCSMLIVGSGVTVIAYDGGDSSSKRDKPKPLNIFLSNFRDPWHHSITGANINTNISKTLLISSKNFV